MTETLRPAAVAGMFYTASPAELERDISMMLAHVSEAPLHAKVLLVPHAGYIYSGAIAASAYACLANQRDTVRRVVLLGPAHRLPFRGLAASSVDWFETPLGRLRLDRDALALIAHLPQVSTNDLAHAQEHALEVQLPFLQHALTDFALLPLVVGAATTDEVAEVLDLLWGEDDTLIVISSDLSHYHPYAEACRIDQATADAVLNLAPVLTHEQACGATPVNGLLAVARRRKLQVELLDLRNSGDTAGDRERVVGYASFAFCEAGQAGR